MVNNGKFVRKKYMTGSSQRRSVAIDRRMRALMGRLVSMMHDDVTSALREYMSDYEASDDDRALSRDIVDNNM